MRQTLRITLIALLSIIAVVQAQSGDLPPCSDTQLMAVHGFMPGIKELYALAADVRTLDDLVVYSQAHITWREQLWINTPPCSEAFEMALLSNQLTADYLASLLVNARKESAAVNPYKAWQFEGAERFDVLWNALPPPDQSVETVEQAPSARSLPACTEAERLELLDAFLPAYDRLTDIANAVETFEDFLAFIEAQIDWRKTSLMRYPPCAEAIEIAWLANQTASDISALFAFHFVGVPAHESPYSDPERQGTRRLGEFDEMLRSSPPSKADTRELPAEVMLAIERELGNPSGGNWRPCSASELQTALNLIPEYDTLVTQAWSIETMEDLLAYSAEMIEWRESLVSDLSHCGEVLEVAWIMSENIGDLATMFTYGFVDTPYDESPVYQQVMSNIGGVQLWSDVLSDLVNHRDSEPAARPGSSGLPECTTAELDDINRILADHYALYEATGVVETLEGYVAFSQAQLAWRENNWALLPLCGNSFEYFLRMSWTNNDTTLAGVLHFFADVPYDENPFWPAVSSFKPQADELLNRLRSIDKSQSDEAAKSSR